MAAAAGTLYGALFGLGVWIIGAPVPLGLSRAFFVAASLLLSAALVPIWLRKLRSETP